ncbi:copper chaperone PCu(A)C [Octadecabacter sp. CECT 8868]|uniref:copper chaperone PCu(A)C n=1 Tax=Octadecabacter algicola TaxID=2909342 RepID=UPI001F2CABD7|nr:copper chaperone PCu(A)C [Octadecabacter algicola]MCF2905287.1 copper chaperone PCu(A)C [Octadecabacter algicola]
MSFKSILLGAAMALPLATAAFAEVEVHDQYARSSNAMAGAAFMLIHNHGDTDDRLIAVTSDVAARTELHTHIENAEGVMQMIHVEEGFELPAGGDITMERGGNHVMFMGLNEPFADDQTVTITLTFEEAGDVVVEIPVDQERMDHGTMDHGSDHSDH